MKSEYKSETSSFSFTTTKRSRIDSELRRLLFEITYSIISSMSKHERPEKGQVESARQNFLQKAVSREFLTGEGAVIQEHLNRLVGSEVALAQRQPELFILPPSATVNLAPLSGDDRLLFTGPAREFVQAYSNPLREITIDLYHQNLRPSNGIVFKSTPLKLANNQWKTLALSLHTGQRNAYPEIDFEQMTSDFKAEKHKDEFSDETMTKIYEALTGNGDDAYDDLTLEAAYSNYMALLQLVEFPDSIASILPIDKMVLSPSRLMTDEEYEKWKKSVDSLKIDSKRDRMGSTEIEYTAASATDMPVLHERWIRSDDMPDSEITYIPLEVLDGERRLGWQIGEILQFPNMPLKVRFIHGDQIRLLDLESISSSNES